MSFQNNLRAQRTKKGFSQEKVAEEVCVSRQTISKWENGDTYPSTKHSLLLVKIFGCDVNDLIDCCPHKEQCDQDNSAIQAAPLNWRKRSYFMAGAIATLFLILCSIVMTVVRGSVANIDSAIDLSKVAVFDAVVDGSFESALVADGYATKKVVGYGIVKESGEFYVKCELVSTGQSGPCSAIIYFCDDNGTYSYQCQYLDDSEYLPDGEFYKIN